MIETAERQGKLKPGATVERPPANTDRSCLESPPLRVIADIDDARTDEREAAQPLSLMSAFDLTPDTKDGRIHQSRELLDKRRIFHAAAFNNPANPDVHRKTTAVEY